MAFRLGHQHFSCLCLNWKISFPWVLSPPASRLELDHQFFWFSGLLTHPEDPGSCQFSNLMIDFLPIMSSHDTSYPPWSSNSINSMKTIVITFSRLTISMWCNHSSLDIIWDCSPSPSLFCKCSTSHLECGTESSLGTEVHYHLLNSNALYPLMQCTLASVFLMIIFLTHICINSSAKPSFSLCTKILLKYRNLSDSYNS